MTAHFPSNYYGFYTDNFDEEFLPMAERVLTIALLLYSLQHLKNIGRTLRQRQETLNACFTNETLAKNFSEIDRKIFLPFIVTELLCLTSSCCFALLKFYEYDTKLYGCEITPFHLSALEAIEFRTMKNHYNPNIDALMASI